jgi:hypothetical protein
MMGLTKPFFVAVLAIALAAYAIDCGAATTPELAKQCCDSMPCSSHGHHGEDCCKTMPTVRAPFVQTSSVHGVSYTLFVFAELPASSEVHGLESSDRMIAAHCHAPPIRYASASLSLRI